LLFCLPTAFATVVLLGRIARTVRAARGQTQNTPAILNVNRYSVWAALGGAGATY
jgi:hypothetical protein